MNWDYPEGNYATRDRIVKEHENYTSGFLHFLATSPRGPENIRAEMQTWGGAGMNFSTRAAGRASCTCAKHGG